MKKMFLVIVDDGAHDGHVVMVDMADIWTPFHLQGWNYQDYTHSHGRVAGEF